MVYDALLLLVGHRFLCCLCRVSCVKYIYFALKSPSICQFPYIYKYRYNYTLLKNHNNFEKYLIKALQIQIL